MQLKALMATVALALLAQTARAQPIPQPDATRLQLARDVVAESGGAKAAEARLRAVFSQSFAVVKANMPAPQGKFMDQMLNDMIAEESKSIPKMMDDTAEIYAEQFTETELRDLLAWTRSESGKAIREKMPAVTAQLITRQAPQMQAMMKSMMQKLMDRACDEAKCSPADRKAAAEIVAKYTSSITK